VSPICVGVSHRTADLNVLDRLAVPAPEIQEILERLLAKPYVAGAILLSTCGRVEVYAEVSGFHGGLTDIAAVFGERLDLDVADLAPHLYVHYDEAAVRHLFRVSSGLDSMVVGESQILGQLRDAYQAAAEAGAAAPVLHDLMQQALRVGKRVQSDTGINQAGQSVVSAAMECCVAVNGSLAGRSVLVIGAGAMGALALASLRRAGATPLLVTNRSPERAALLAANHQAHAVPFDDLATPLSHVDLVVTGTAAPQPLLRAELLSQARPRGKPLLICDLSVPRNVDPGVATLPWVTLIDMERVAEALPNQVGPGVGAAEEIVEAEVDLFVTALRGQTAAPTVAALRARAGDVVTTELNRLTQRCDDLTATQQAEITNAVHRIIQRLLHQPTVRVRQLATQPGGERYVRALRELFDLRVPEVGADKTLPARPAAVESLESGR
jgi:glutamyl-tRNA reductase